MVPTAPRCHGLGMDQQPPDARLAAGRVFGDVRVHVFTDAPAMALCGAGVLMLSLGSWAELDDDADVCAMCTDLLRRPDR